MQTALRLLLVESSDDDAASIASTLREGAYAVTQLRVGTSTAFDAALAVGHSWDLVIVAHGLDGFDALDALALLQDHNADLPCIIVSEMGDDATAIGYVRAGAADFVTKADLTALVPAVQRVRAAHAARAKTTARMIQIDRMVCAGTLAAGVGHEINNPLAYVMTNLEWLAERLRAVPGLTEPEEEVHVVIAECQTGARRIRDIVRGLQTFARGDAQPVGPVDLRSILESAVSMASSAISAATKVRYDHATLALAQASESRVGQVFLNLVVNAAQAIKDAERGENEIVIRTWSNDHDVMASVSDTGNGIEASALSRIFDPFFTTKPFGLGAGLGLAICRDIVTGLGGEITVESIPGEGATFTVRLPRFTGLGGASRASAPPRRGGERPAVRRRVLVVDDEERLGAAFERMLGDEHDVVFLAEGRAAKELLDRGEDFDVVFLDLMMPDVSGMDLYEHLEATRPAMLHKVMIMTGGAYTRSARELVDRLQTPPLPKPLDFDELRELIAALPLPA